MTRVWRDSMERACCGDTVPRERPESDDRLSDVDLDGPQPTEQRVRVRRGWLVDVEETDR